MRDAAQATVPAEVFRALEAFDPGVRVTGATLAGRGWDVVAWRIPTRVPGGDWLLRVPRSPDVKPTIEAQHRLAVALRGTGLPVPTEPALLRADDGELLAGLYRFVAGEPARVAGRAARQRLAQSLGSFLVTLHTRGTEAALVCAPQRYEPWRDMYQPMVERCMPLVGPATAAWLRELGGRLEAASRAVPPHVLVHADLKPDHVVLDPAGEILGVLDFEGACITDPVMDFRRIIQHWGIAFAQQVLAHYSCPVDEHFLLRARLYRDLDALEVLDSTAGQHNEAEWGARARRDLASRAAAETRRRAVSAGVGAVPPRSDGRPALGVS